MCVEREIGRKRDLLTGLRTKERPILQAIHVGSERGEETKGTRSISQHNPVVWIELCF